MPVKQQRGRAHGKTFAAAGSPAASIWSGVCCFRLPASHAQRPFFASPSAMARGLPSRISLVDLLACVVRGQALSRRAPSGAGGRGRSAAPVSRRTARCGLKRPSRAARGSRPPFRGRAHSSPGGFSATYGDGTSSAGRPSMHSSPRVAAPARHTIRSAAAMRSAMS